MWLNRCAPRLRVRSRKHSDPMGVRRTTRTGRADATSRWRRSYTDNADIDFLWPHQYCSIPASSDGKRASRCSHRTVRTGQPSHAYFGTLASMPRCMFLLVCIRDVYASRRLQLTSGKPPPVACVYGTRTVVIARSDLDYSPKWLPLAACNNALVRCILRFR